MSARANEEGAIVDSSSEGVSTLFTGAAHVALLAMNVPPSPYLLSTVTASLAKRPAVAPLLRA